MRRLSNIGVLSFVCRLPDGQRTGRHGTVIHTPPPANETRKTPTMQLAAKQTSFFLVFVKQIKEIL